MRPELVRLRADPTKVRVAIMRWGYDWICTIAQIGYGYECAEVRPNPRDAVEAALLKAASLRMRGVDLDCQWAYPHPQR